MLADVGEEVNCWEGEEHYVTAAGSPTSIGTCVEAAGSEWREGEEHGMTAAGSPTSICTCMRKERGSTLHRWP